MFLFSKAKVPVVPTVDCQAIYKSGLNIDINDFHICAGNGNMDSCSGDSGLLVSMLKQASLIKNIPGELGIRQAITTNRLFPAHKV